ncbi:hypothetical protein, partial [Flexistipes sinusarabici]|uniref:hypothetical protein n=1 Tax=Flexistipes sinusarabici TaxID=2352 RepID=UPI0026EE658A
QICARTTNQPARKIINPDLAPFFTKLTQFITTFLLITDKLELKKVLLLKTLNSGDQKTSRK